MANEGTQAPTSTTDEILPFTCVKCGGSVPVKRVRVIDTTRNEELRGRVLSGEFFKQICPHCGEQMVVAYPCVYIDNNTDEHQFHSLFIDMCASEETAIGDEDTKSGLDDGGWDEQWRMQGEHDFRVAVVGLMQLQEVIRIAALFLDPIVMAKAKKHFVDNANLPPLDWIYVDRVEDKKIFFVYKPQGENTVVSATTEHKLYFNYARELGERDYEPLRLCEYIDYKNIDELLARCSSTIPLTDEFKHLRELTKNTNAPDAWYNLGVLYYNGDGVSRNVFKAFRCFRTAAESGYPEAEYALAMCYSNGMGATVSPFRAHAWIKASAEHGYSEAQYALGKMYEEGSSVERDYTEALHWYQKAADQNHESAAEAIERMRVSDDKDGELAVEDATPVANAAISPKDGDVEMKIGKVAQRVMPVLFSEHRISGEDIEFLMSDTAVKLFKSRGNRVLKETTGDPEVDAVDGRGRRRFYSKIILPFEGRRFLMTSQWFGEGLNGLLEWFERHGIERARVVQIYNQAEEAKVHPPKASDGARAGRSNIRVTFADGTVLEGKKAADVFAQAIQKIGAERVAALHIMHCGEPLVSNDVSVYVKYSKALKPCGDGWFTNTYSSTQAKAQFLERIGQVLGVGLTVDIVQPVEMPVSDTIVEPRNEFKVENEAEIAGNDETTAEESSQGEDSARSSEQKFMVECPKCQQKFEPVCKDHFDLDEHPEMVENIMRLSAFEQLCPHCQETSIMPYPTVVMHLSKGYFIRLCFDYDEAIAVNRSRVSEVPEEITGKIRQRVVCSPNQLREKILIFESDVDDNVIEVMKLNYLMANKDKAVNYIRFAGVRDGKFNFAIYLKDMEEPKPFGVPCEFYDKILADLKQAFPEDFMRFVTVDTIAKILSGEEEEKLSLREVLVNLFASRGGELGLFTPKSFIQNSEWTACGNEIAKRIIKDVVNDDELDSYERKMQIAAMSCLHIGAGAAVEWRAAKIQLRPDKVYDIMMSEGGFCRCFELSYERLSPHCTPEFRSRFEKYTSAIEGFVPKGVVQCGLNLDAGDKGETWHKQYWTFIYEMCFAAFLCGVNAAMNLLKRGVTVIAKGGIAVEFDYSQEINLALAQNNCPLISSLKVKNVTGGKMENLVCVISSPDNFFEERTEEIGALWPGAVKEFGSTELNYNVGLLKKVEDSQPGKIRVVVASGEEVLFQGDYDVRALSFDQSHNIFKLPGLVASFVRPNCEAIHQLQSEVATEIHTMTGDAALEGYQSDRDRVFKMCAAIYRAIQKKGVAYSNPAAGFGLPGQKIRMPDTIFKYKLATCLDSTILFASIMEACQLHPVIIIISGHAFVGCHLVEANLPSVEIREPQILRKLAANNDFMAIETTMVTSDASFEEAEKCGQARLGSDRDGSFVCAVDVVLARYNGIHPLAIGGEDDSEFVASGHYVKQTGVGKLRKMGKAVDLKKLKQAVVPTGRIAVWAKKLLDLSPTNKLLNAKDSKDVFLFHCPDVGALEDWLALGNDVAIRSIYDAFTSKDQEDIDKGAISGVRIQQIVDAEFACKRICLPDSKLTPRKLRKRLVDIYRTGRTDLEETGAQTLFVAIGFLSWKDPKKRSNAKANLAPLILVPIKIAQHATNFGTMISKRDDETVVNTTLLQFLRSQYQINVPGLDPLPTDDAGLDVPHILQIFKECVKSIPDLEIVEDAAVGRFSFGKFAMWRDLMENSALLEKSPLVNHLINAGGHFDDGISVFPQEQVSAHLKPGELYCPVSADSSQLTAVLYSELGKSFVLYGPPGTGKSQTITNMIAHNLAIGRRVMFVSEKKAALDVVHKRLKEVGLEPFCLELHSNKSDRGAVMQQFVSSLEVTKKTASQDWKRSADQICRLRDELAGYVEALHHKYPNGLTAYDCFARQLEKGAPKYQDLISWDCLTQTWENMEEQKNALRSLCVEIKNTTVDALRTIPQLKEATWSVLFERGLRDSAERLEAACRELEKAYSDVAGKFSLPPIHALDDDAILKSVELLKVVKSENKVLNLASSGELNPEDLKTMIVESENLSKRKTEILKAREEAEEALIGWDIAKLSILDVASVRMRIEEAEHANLFVRPFKEGAILKDFAPLKQALGKLTLSELKAALSRMENLRRARKVVEEFMEAEASRLQDVASVVSDNDEGRLDDDVLAKVDRALVAWNEYQLSRGRFLDYVDDAVCGNAPEVTAALCDALLTNIDKIRGVFRYRSFRSTANTLGVGGFADKFESGEIPASELIGAYMDAYHGKMLIQVEETSPLLPSFFGRSHETKISEFKQLIDRYSELSQGAIFAKIAAQYPDFEGGHFSKEEDRQLGVLQREINKKRGQTSVRKFLEDVGDLVKRYKPCFLMSPLSVAQFLEMDLDPFDLIIFDEASQIEVCDAIGVMARGKQVIVVGDPQQMPPTNFFGGSSGQDSDQEIEDAESILVECLNVGLPKTYLNWHYRSRHESLIAFSNHNYYEDELYSFPSVSESERLGVKFFYVKNGVYGHGQNLNEAQAVVDYVSKRVKSSVYKKRPRSIGIVTFNSTQQGVIEDLFEKRCEEDSELKSILFGADGDTQSNEKMFFVRNLENVQGDEADVIIFSITFGPDEAGNVSMNFGPLNRDGGERRLNVAVTRAREQMVVFASMKYTRISSDPDLALGARGLRSFLEYAETGSRSSSCKAAAKGDSGFGTVVANFIEAHGFKVVRNVGYSGYKIDMAVLNPYDDKEYILGIECDGPSYAKQFTVRDRDVLRSSVLARGGWKMCRVWCAEWYHDRAGAEARLLELLETIKPEPPSHDPEEFDDTPGEIIVDPPKLEVDSEKDIKIVKEEPTSTGNAHSSEAAVSPQPSATIPDEAAPAVTPVMPVENPKESDEQPSPLEVDRQIPSQPPTPEPSKDTTVPLKPVEQQVAEDISPRASESSGFPLTEKALTPVRSPLALLFDGQKVRVVSSWKDCYLALCQKLMDLDPAKFDTLPDQPAFRRFFIRHVVGKRYADCYREKLGTLENVRVKEINSKSYFYMPTYVVHNLLRYFNVDVARITIQA